jgi:hypothetical protein
MLEKDFAPRANEAMSIEQVGARHTIQISMAATTRVQAGD